MTTVEDYIAATIKTTDTLNRQFAVPEPNITHIQFFNEQIVTNYSGTKIEIRGIGSSFVLGDTLYGKLGSQSPQPYIGDSRPAFINTITTNQGSPFLNSGLTQVRDFLLGSSTAVAPTILSTGSGTQTWHGSLQALQSFSKNYTISSRVGEGSQYGSFVTTVASVNFPTINSVASTSFSITSGLSFDGVDDILSGIPNTLTSIVSGTPFTVECWAKGTFDTNARTLVLKGRDTNPTTDWGLVSSLAVAAGSLEFFVKDTGGTNRTTSTSNPSNNVWHHIAAIYAGDGSLFIYKDGTLAGSSSAIYNPLNTGQVITAGAQYNTLNGIQSEFLGSIDEIRVSNIRRYTSNFTVPSGQFSTDSNTRLLWHLDEGTGTTAVDATGSLISGTLVGNTAWVQGSTYSGTNSTTTSLLGSFSEIMVSGGAGYIYDSFTTQYVGSIGSEIRFNNIFRIGS